MTTDSKRIRLQTIDPDRAEEMVSNPGLVLDRYLATTGDKHEAAKKLYAAVAAAKPTDAYRQAFDRWKQTLIALNAATDNFVVRTRLIVGLGSESVRETGITLHHTYGMPVIPGSALKGLLAHYVAPMSGLTQKERDVLIGTTDDAGFLSFFDAWYVPGPPAESPFRRDVITVHHPIYYASRGEKRAPWDFDDPNPVPFITAVGRYLIAVRCREDPAWATLALALLERALGDWGVGAKTSSGYGRLDRDTPPAPPDPLLAEIRSLPVEEVRADPRVIQRLFYDRLREAPVTTKREGAGLILDKLSKAGINRDLGPWLGRVKLWAQSKG